MGGRVSQEGMQIVIKDPAVWQMQETASLKMAREQHAEPKYLRESGNL